MRSDENFLHENSLPILICTANIWRVLEVNENNIITRIFLTQKVCEQNQHKLRYNYITVKTGVGVMNILG